MMKKVILSIAVVAALGMVSCNTQAKKEATSTSVQVELKENQKALSFGVRGNCAMCKKTIEEAVTSVDGVVNADWNVDEKKIDVVADKSVNVMSLHQAIATAGYDTDKVSAKEESYQNLPGCCQYNQDMKMSR